MRCILRAVPLFLLAAPLHGQTGLTIYNDGRILVRRTLSAPVPAGASTHRLALGLLDPGSVFPLDSGVVITGAAYDESVDEVNTMRRAVGTTLRFWTGSRTNGVRDIETATVLGVNPERFRLSDGTVSFNRPGVPLYPAELVQTDPALTLGVRSPAARPSLRLGWFTQGASWGATYAVVLGKGSARVTGLASIPSASLRVTDAEVQLLAGNVGRDYAAKAFEARAPMAAARVAMDVAAAPASEESIGEVHLYTLPGRLALEPGVTTSVSLFEPVSAPWERNFVVRGQLPWYGMLPQYGTDENQVPVEVSYTLKRTAKTPFGDLPLPAGTWRLYDADTGGRLQLIGESGGSHTAPGSDIRLSAGSAFDLTAKRVQLTYSTRRDSTRTIATADYRVTLTSAKDSASVVDVIEERRGEWSVLSSSVPAERLSSTRMRFRVRVPANGEAVLNYRVRVIW